MNAIKKYTLSDIAGGQMGTISRKYKIGDAYVYSINGFSVVKEVYYKEETRYRITGRNIKEALFMNVLDLEKIEEINSKNKNDEIANIMLSDVTRIEGIITKNKKGFMFFMNNFMTEGVPKAIAFAHTIRDYYKKDFSFPSDNNSIIKIMIQYGYSFCTKKEAEQTFEGNNF